MAYIWQLEQWPHLGWDVEALSPLLARVSRERGRLLDHVEWPPEVLDENDGDGGEQR